LLYRGESKPTRQKGDTSAVGVLGAKTEESRLKKEANDSGGLPSKETHNWMVKKGGGSIGKRVKDWTGRGDRKGGHAIEDYSPLSINLLFGRERGLKKKGERRGRIVSRKEGKRPLAGR